MPVVGTRTTDGSTFICVVVTEIEYSPGSRWSAKEPSPATRTLCFSPPVREKTSVIDFGVRSHGCSVGQLGAGP